MRDYSKRKPFTVPIRTTVLTMEDVHTFNELFIKRYSIQISEGEDMREVWEREIDLFEKGVAFFENGLLYHSIDGSLIAYIDFFAGNGEITVSYYYGEWQCDFETVLEHDSDSEFFSIRHEGETYTFRADHIIETNNYE